MDPTKVVDVVGRPPVTTLVEWIAVLLVLALLVLVGWLVARTIPAWLTRFEAQRQLDRGAVNDALNRALAAFREECHLERGHHERQVATTHTRIDRLEEKVEALALEVAKR